MPLPKVTVLMAVHNGAPYVSLAVESILNQTLGNFEFIIVDDGSMDNTLESLCSFDDPRIRVLENKTNVGLAKSLNRGIALAEGMYIARQDADDISHPERLERQVSYLDQHPQVGVVGCAAQWMDEVGRSTNKIWPWGGDNAELQQRLVYVCPLIHGSAVYRRQCFEEVGGYDEAMRTGQDYDFWLRISEAWDLACLPNVLYHYRWHDNMATVKQKEEQARNVRIGVERALQRRLSYASLALGIRPQHVLPRLKAMSRRRLAERYTWWSAGARMIDRWVAFQFLAIALMLYPASGEAWHFLKGIVYRKLRTIRFNNGRETSNYSGKEPLLK